MERVCEVSVYYLPAGHSSCQGQGHGWPSQFTLSLEIARRSARITDTKQQYFTSRINRRSDCRYISDDVLVPERRASTAEFISVDSRAGDI